MKKIFIFIGGFLIVGLSVFQLWNMSQSEKENDTNKYTLAEEFSYIMLQKQYDDAVVVSIFNSRLADKKDAVTSVADIGREDRHTINLQLKYAKRNLTSLKQKKEVVDLIRAYKIDYLEQAYEDDEAKLKIFTVFKNNLNAASKAAILEKEDFVHAAFLVYGIFLPDINLAQWESTLSQDILDVAEQIALTRFDIAKIYQQVKKCYSEKAKKPLGDNIEMETVEACMESYNKQFQHEMDNVVNQLMMSVQDMQKRELEAQNKVNAFEDAFYSQFEGQWEILNENEFSFGKELDIVTVNTRPDVRHSKIMMLHDRQKKGLVCFIFDPKVNSMLCSRVELNKNEITREDRIDLIVTTDELEGEKYWAILKKSEEDFVIRGAKLRSEENAQDEQTQEHILFKLRKR